LDEIGDISPAMQVKLLRVLQERSFSPIGSGQEIKADVRIVAATHKPLETMIERGEFRADLFFRLNVLPITLPPLRERRDDIHLLCQYLIKKFNKTHKRKITGISDEALKMLLSHQWPGNIRELENAMERAFIMESTEILQAESFDLKASSQGSMIPQNTMTQSITTAFNSGADVSPSHTSSGRNSETSGFIKDGDELNFPVLREKFEREFIIKALTAYRGRINQTAEATQMTKVTLLRKLEKYGIDAKDYFKI
jgi:DNA-binding NtrC family response regulator